MAGTRAFRPSTFVGIGLSGKGSAYIEPVFRWAHKADPHALLFYNEAEGAGLNRSSDAIYMMVKDFKRRGVPIDGVGLQMHIPGLDADMTAITAALSANMRRLTALGLQIHIPRARRRPAAGCQGRASTR